MFAVNVVILVVCCVVVSLHFSLSRLSLVIFLGGVHGRVVLILCDSFSVLLAPMAARRILLGMEASTAPSRARTTATDLRVIASLSLPWVGI